MENNSLHNDTFLAKWLNNELSPTELVAFEKTGDFETYSKIIQTLKKAKEALNLNFKPTTSNLNSRPTTPNLNSRPTTPNLESRPTKLISITPAIRNMMRIAAVLVIVLTSYYFFNDYSNTAANHTIVVENAGKGSTVLPDQSEVQINAGSTVSYNSKRWNKKREVNLEGEAYFSVAKGSVFEVKTPLGNVTVLGTKFNVIARDNFFQVVCFEGSVNVAFNNKTYLLTANKGIQFLDNVKKPFTFSQKNVPSWMNNESHFNSLPFEQVIWEFERQYNTKVATSNVDTSQLFTGVFTHNNKEAALQSICFPLHLKFTILKDGKVSLEKQNAASTPDNKE